MAADGATQRPSLVELEAELVERVKERKRRFSGGGSWRGRKWTEVKVAVVGKCLAGGGNDG